MAADMSADASNARPIAIFSSYMAAAAILSAICLRVASGTAKPATSRVAAAKTIFTVLAVLSLSSTWYYMFRFFEWSYNDWKLTRPAAQSLQLGSWLRDTKLFEQAWTAVLVNRARAWWSAQIIGFCVYWSVSLGWQADNRGIRHAWAFILLGQIVAISFAMNLSFLAFLSHTPKRKPTQLSRTLNSLTPTGWAIVVGGTVVGAASSRAVGTPAFMWMLLAPHVLSFVPLFPGWVQTCVDEPPWFYLQVSLFAGLFVRAIQDFPGVAAALYDHPAMSSLGWDVICCWATLLCWQCFFRDL